MTSDDLRRLFLGPTLFRLDLILATRLVPIGYGVGLVAILVWAINHLFRTFGSGFGNGLWGLVEIAVFGLLALIVLRLACEALLVFFKAHEDATDELGAARAGSTLLEEVRDAIHDLADADSGTIEVSEPVHSAPAPAARPVSLSEPVHRPATPGRSPAAKPRRTARRTPVRTQTAEPAPSSSAADGPSGDPPRGDGDPS